MSAFARAGAGYAAWFDAVESELLHDLLGSLVTLLTADRDRRDPLMVRLFPDVYPDDAAASDELRNYTDDDLAAGKRDQTTAVLQTLPREGGTVDLDEEQAEQWLRTLTDARLALGTRLELTDDTDLDIEIDEAVVADPTAVRVHQLWVYRYLTYLQSTLLDALIGTDLWDAGGPDTPDG